MNSFILTCAKQAILYRECAKDKKHSYKTRLVFDQCAARWEQALINLAVHLEYKT